MALIQLTSFVDITRGGFTTGVLSKEPVQLREFGQADAIHWSIKFVETLPDKGYTVPYSVVEAPGLSLKVAIGFLAQTPLCEQDVWVYNPPPSNFVEGTLDFDTAAMRAAFPSGVNYIEPYLEFRLTDAAGVITPIHQQIFIFRQLILSGSPPSPPPPGQVFYDSSELNALYVKRVGLPGEGFFMVSPDGNQAVFVMLGNDGSMQFSPVSPPP